MRQPGCKPGASRTYVSSRCIQALRILVPRWTEFDAVWQTANRICDRDEIGKRAPE
jgi:hypothetical protein